MSTILELSLYSLSHNLAHLEHSWNTLALDKGRKRENEKVKEKNMKQGIVGSSGYMGVSL